MTKARKNGGAKPGAGGSGASGSKPKASQAATAAKLFQQAQIALRFDDFEAAKAALARAAALAPSDATVLDAYACLLAELSDPGARTALQHAIQVAPDSGHEKYMYLAQLLDEEPGAALTASAQGIALLQAKLAAAAADPVGAAGEARRLRRELCGALCTRAEMVLGHACAAREEAVDAEVAAAARQGRAAAPPAAPPDPRTRPLGAAAVQEVEALLAQASALQPHSPEPGQALACLRSEQGLPGEALAALRASMSLWWDFNADSSSEEYEEVEHPADMVGEAQGAAPMDAEGPGRGSGGRKRGPVSGLAAGPSGAATAADEEGEGEETDSTPSFEFRFECAKLLLELEDTTDNAVGVLSALVQEYDSNPDAWHLLALALYSGHHYEEALEVVGRGTALLRRLGVPKKDDSWAAFEELSGAIKEAMGHSAAAAGAAGIKTGRA